MVFGLALIIIPAIVGGLLLYSLIKLWQDEDKECEKQQAYSAELADGVYRGKRDVNLAQIHNSSMTNTFMFKIRKGELYNIERMKNRDGYFAVELTKDLSVVLDANRIDNYFEKVVKVPKVESAER